MLQSTLFYSRFLPLTLVQKPLVKRPTAGATTSDPQKGGWGGGGRIQPGISRAPGRLKSAAAFVAIVTGGGLPLRYMLRSSKNRQPPLRSATHNSASKRQTPRTHCNVVTRNVARFQKTNVREKLLPVAPPPPPSLVTAERSTGAFNASLFECSSIEKTYSAIGNIRYRSFLQQHSPSCGAAFRPDAEKKKKARQI